MIRIALVCALLALPCCADYGHGTTCPRLPPISGAGNSSIFDACYQAKPR